jgi:osmotically-inducible protein OsmY
MFTTKLLGKILFGICLMSALSGCETAQGNKRNQGHLDDSAVTAKVTEALAKDPILQKYRIEVLTVSGEVVLKGHVDSPQDVYKAAEVVNKVEGVKSLLNLLSDK